MFDMLGKLFVLVLILGGGYWGYTEFMAPPKAVVEFAQLGFSVESQDTRAWENCTFIINPTADTADQYTYQTDHIDAGQTQLLMSPQFAKADGSRFIPFMHKASTFAINCKKPMMGFETNLESNG